MKGVPIRVEFGPQDPAKDVISWARRETGEKGILPLADSASKVPVLLETIQQALYDKADKSFRERRLQITEWDKVVPASTPRTWPSSLIA
jgi:prolyl-tRNA synthetase